MSADTAFRVLISESDVTARWRPLVQSVTVTDLAGAASDVAVIQLDDQSSQIAMPAPGVPVAVWLGSASAGMLQVFAGVVDEVDSNGSRAGQTLAITARGMDTIGAAKEPQTRSWHDQSIEAILSDAGNAAGVSVRTDPDLGGIQRRYEAMDGESFASFGQRLARELGGTFKIRGSVAVLAKRNAARAPNGQPLATVTAIRGRNLLSWSIKPFLGRTRYSEVRVRWYDTNAATEGLVLATTGTPDATAAYEDPHRYPSEEVARERAQGLVEELKRGAGAGRLTMVGDPRAQAEALCAVSALRPGIDGTYTIESVHHRYSRSAGYLTDLTIAGIGG